jgi:hypothetical protein
MSVVAYRPIPCGMVQGRRGRIHRGMASRMNRLSIATPETVVGSMKGHRSNAHPSRALSKVLNRAKHSLPAAARTDALDHESVASLIASGKITREKSCDSKKRYRTFEYADHEVRPSLEARHGKVYRTYACAFCNGFHLATEEELAA